MSVTSSLCMCATLVNILSEPCWVQCDSDFLIPLLLLLTRTDAWTGRAYLFSIMHTTDSSSIPPRVYQRPKQRLITSLMQTMSLSIRRSPPHHQVHIVMAHTITTPTKTEST